MALSDAAVVCLHSQSCLMTSLKGDKYASRCIMAPVYFGITVHELTAASSRNVFISLYSKSTALLSTDF